MIKRLFVPVYVVLFCSLTISQVTRTQITFEDIKPSGYSLSECWSGMGMDNLERTFIGFTSIVGSDTDFVLFRYNVADGSRRYITTYRTTSNKVGNLVSGEDIPKGHTHLVQIGNKLYMGSQSFHDFKQQLTALNTKRGSHLYSYDLTADTSLYDVSKNFTNGVVQEHQGMIACAAVPGTGYLVGLSHPYSDIVVFNTITQHVDTIVPGIPWRMWNVVSRDIIATKTGDVYTLRNPEENSMRDTTNPMYKYNIFTKQSGPTSYRISGGYIGCQSPTRDGNKIYFGTVNGELYVIDVATGAISHLRSIMTDAEVTAGTKVRYLWAMSLSYNETKLYTIGLFSGSTGKMYEYDIATGTVTMVLDMGSGWYTGSNMRDTRGNLYFSGFNSNFGGVRLEVLNVNNRAGTPNVVTFTSTAVTTATVGSAYSYTIAVTGSPTATISVSGLPSWLSYNSTTKTISGTPLTANIGLTTGAITVTASNTSGGTQSQIFRITVAASTFIKSGFRILRATEGSANSHYFTPNGRMIVDKGNFDSETTRCSLSSGIYIVKTAEGPRVVLVDKY